MQGDFTMETQAYCVKCRKTQTVKNATVKEAANGRRMAQGTCPECGTKVTRFLSSKKTA
jgi:RNase P subunit RPR2